MEPNQARSHGNKDLTSNKSGVRYHSTGLNYENGMEKKKSKTKEAGKLAPLVAAQERQQRRLEESCGPAEGGQPAFAENEDMAKPKKLVRSSPRRRDAP